MTEETLKPVAWMDDGTTRAGSTATSFRVVTDGTKKGMPSASAVNFHTPLVRLSDAQAALAEKDKRIGELERERDEATGTLRYCEKQWSDERGVMIDKFVYERNRADAIAEAAERQLSEIAGHMDSECDSDSILHGIREAEADRDIYKARATAAESEAARLRALLAEAREVVERARQNTPGHFSNWHDAARALAEKLEKEIGNE